MTQTIVLRVHANDLLTLTLTFVTAEYPRPSAPEAITISSESYSRTHSTVRLLPPLTR